MQHHAAVAQKIHLSKLFSFPEPPLIDGDPNHNSSNEEGYDINWVADAKLRLGTDVGKAFGLAPGKLTAYGFVGKSVGDANPYWTGYSTYTFSGSNFGLGVESTFSNNAFVGIEAIRRNVTSSYEGDGYETSQQAVSLRVGFKF